MVVDYDDIYVFESHTYDGKGICTVCGSVAKNNKPADNPSNVTKDEPKNTLEKTPVVSDVKVSSINVTGISNLAHLLSQSARLNHDLHISVS